MAVIMDGNGRWALRRGLPRMAGHRQGARVVHDVVANAPTLGVGALTVFAFSTENWKRSAEEVSGILQLFVAMVTRWLPDLIKQHVRVRIIGERAELPSNVQTAVRAIEQQTESGTGLHLNVALNYGGRAEIVQAARSFAAECAVGDAIPESLTESAFESRLWLSDEKPPDMVIRTGGESRMSNFLLWEMAYAELFFLDVLWPDFTPDTLAEVIHKFRQRNRRFGGT